MLALGWLSTWLCGECSVSYVYDPGPGPCLASKTPGHRECHGGRLINARRLDTSFFTAWTLASLPPRAHIRGRQPSNTRQSQFSKRSLPRWRKNVHSARRVVLAVADEQLQIGPNCELLAHIDFLVQLLSRAPPRTEGNTATRVPERVGTGRFPAVGACLGPPTDRPTNGLGEE